MKYAKSIKGTIEVKEVENESAELVQQGWKPVCEQPHEEGDTCTLIEYPTCFVEQWFHETEEAETMEQ